MPNIEETACASFGFVKYLLHTNVHQLFIQQMPFLFCHIFIIQTPFYSKHTFLPFLIEAIYSVFSASILLVHFHDC